MEFDTNLVLQLIGVLAAADRGLGRDLRRVGKRAEPFVRMLRFLALNNNNR